MLIRNLDSAVTEQLCPQLQNTSRPTKKQSFDGSNSLVTDICDAVLDRFIFSKSRIIKDSCGVTLCHSEKKQQLEKVSVPGIPS